MIPKIIHYIWLGPYKDECTYVDDWNNIMPEYEVIRWTNDNPLLIRYLNEAIKMLGGARGVENKSYTYISDLIRLLILRDYGGVYMDHDYIIVKDFSSLLDKHRFVGTFFYDPNLWEHSWNFGKGETVLDIVGKNLYRSDKIYLSDTVNNAFFACEPKHPFIEHAIKLTLDNHFLPSDEQIPMSDWGNGPSIFSKTAIDFGLDIRRSQTVEKNGIIVYERSYFHPINGAQRHFVSLDEYLKLVEEIHLSKSSYAIHVHVHQVLDTYIERKMIPFNKWYQDILPIGSHND